jgi:phosphoribosylamine--glycine ligase
MKILFVSKESNGGDMALRLVLEGNQVKLHIMEKDLHNLDGLIEKETNWRAGVGWSDLVVFDDTGMDEYTKYVLRSGKPAFGMGHSPKDFKIHGASFQGHQFAGELEKNRNMSQEVMSELGIGEEIESLCFTDIPQAIEHLRKHKVPHVIKPELHGSGSEKTYVGKLPNNEDAIGWLETLPTRPGGGKVKKIEVEERKEGVEVACSSWFNGCEFVGPVNINFEHKLVAASEDGKGVGFNTGEMGTAMFYDDRPAKENKLYTETLAKMGKWLSQFDYRGQMDINCIVNEDGVWPLEFTPRLGYPSSYIEDELQVAPWGELFKALGSGKSIDNKVSYDWAMGVVLVGEGYPFWDEGHKRMDQMPVLGLNDKNIEHLHPYDVRYDEKSKRMVATGCYPLTATAKAKTIEECKRKVYEDVIPQVYFPGMFYRHDIGQRVKDNLGKLKEYGYDMGRTE